MNNYKTLLSKILLQSGAIDCVCRFRWLNAAILCLIMTACGGGGGSGDGTSNSPAPQYPLTITITSQPTLTVTQMDMPTTMYMNVNVQGTTTASVIYVQIMDSLSIFPPGQAFITKTGATTYKVGLQTADNLAFGTYTGSFKIDLCQELPCVNYLGRTTVPYSLTVANNPSVTASASINSLLIPVVIGDDPATWRIDYSFLQSDYRSYYAKFSDSAGVIQIQGGATQTITPQQNFSLTVTPSSGITPGTHTGSLDVVFCSDANCSKQFSGISKLPYTITAYQATNLTPLAPIPGGSDWTTLQGNNMHNGYVPIMVDPTKISPRWLWQSSDTVNLRHLLDPVTGDNQVFTVAVPDQTAAYTPILAAINENDGSTNWQKAIPDASTGPNSYGLGDVTAPLISGNSVYLARSANTTGDTGIVAGFNLANGDALFSPSIFSGTPGEFGELSYDPPYADAFYTTNYLSSSGGSLLLGVRDGNYNKFFVGLNETTGSGAAIWSGCTAATGPSGGAAAVDNQNNVYLSTSSGLLLANTCELVSSGNVPLDVTDGPSVVTGTSDVVVVGNGSVVDFDTAQKKINWQIPSGDRSAYAFVGDPAIANGVVYVQNSAYLHMQLEARSELDGSLLWTWTPDWPDETKFLFNVIATQNLVFLSTGYRTYAVDMATHKTVWIYPYPGRLAISSNGILYIRRGNGFAFASQSELAAINLH